MPYFFLFPCKVEVLILLFTFFQFYSVVSRGQQNQQFCKFSFLLLLIIIRSGLIAKIRWSVCMSKSHRSLWASFSRTDDGLCIYHLFVWSNFNFLHISQWISLPTQSCLVVYSYYTNVLYSLIMWMMVSSLSLHNLHLLFYCVLSIFDLIWLVLMALFCTAIWKDFVSFFPLISNVQVFSFEALFIRSLKCPYSCFSSHVCSLVIIILLFIMLSVSFLMAVISPSKFLCNPLVVISMRHRCLQCWQVLFFSPFLIHIFRQHHLLDALCMVISFLVLWSICLSSFLVHFKKGPKYLTRGTAQVFIPFIRFLQDRFVSSSFLVLRYSFSIFSFISTCLMVSASKMLKYL